MRIAFFVRPAPMAVPAQGIAPRVSAVTRRTIALLQAAGARVDVLVAEATAWDLTDLRPAHDLYVLEAKSPLVVSLAEALTGAGAAVVNSARSTRLAKDKIAHSALLARADVPVPASWAVGSLDGVRCLLAETDGPFLVKPPAGSMGRGIRRLARAQDLAGAAGRALRDEMVDDHGFLRPLLAQAAVDGGRDELKVYVVGDWVGATRRTTADRSVRPRTTAVVVPPPVREIALACGRALGLELYGVDVLASDGRFWVVDVNAFPGYAGLEEAPSRLADHILGRARRGTGFAATDVLANAASTEGGLSMDGARNIREHMPVVCSNNKQFATVDHVDGDFVKTTKDDSGQHHWFPKDWVKNVDDKVHVDRPGDQAMREWMSSPPQQAQRR